MRVPTMVYTSEYKDFLEFLDHIDDVCRDIQAKRLMTEDYEEEPEVMPNGMPVPDVRVIVSSDEDQLAIVRFWLAFYREQVETMSVVFLTVPDMFYRGTRRVNTKSPKRRKLMDNVIKRGE